MRSATTYGGDKRTLLVKLHRDELTDVAIVAARKRRRLRELKADLGACSDHSGRNLIIATTLAVPTGTSDVWIWFATPAAHDANDAKRTSPSATSVATPYRSILRGDPTRVSFRRVRAEIDGQAKTAPRPGFGRAWPASGHSALQACEIASQCAGQES